MTGDPTPAIASAPVQTYRLPLELQEADPPAVPALPNREWTEPLLRQNAVWFCRLRWMVVGVLGAVSLAASFPRALAVVGLGLTPTVPLVAALFLAGLNLVFGRLAGGASVKPVLWAQIVTDLLVLTVVVHWLGRTLPAAPFMYLFHIILACIVFTPWESFCVVGLSATFYVGALLLGPAGMLEPNTGVAGIAGVTPVAGLGSAGARSTLEVTAMLLIWGVIWHLVSRLAGALRRHQLELAMTNRRLEASIEERTQHMLLTTHQLKAPFAAIHAQVQLLLGGYCGVLPNAAAEVMGKISQRCLVLSRQIQDMLQLANLRSQGQAAPPRKPVHLDRLVEEVIARVEPAAQGRGIRFERDIQPVVVSGIEDHLTMVADNLVVNAVNYSYDRGVVDVACRAAGASSASLVVRDRGIGIPKAKLPRVFDDYYRTDEAVQHNRGSTGLGLAIVRQVACRDRLEVQVDSAPGWGTRLTVTIPGLLTPVLNPEPQPLADISPLKPSP